MSYADQIIKALGMESVPDEGGSFVRTYTSFVKTHATLQRQAGSAILYLLRSREISRWHRLRADEIWMYHQGSKALQFLLFQDGSWCERIIGPDILAGEMPQSLIPAWTWQTTILPDAQEEDWGLFSTVCVPGFEYKDYFSGDPETLLAQYPDAAERLRELGLS